MTALRWNIVLLLVLGVMGCTTTKIDWEMAISINTVEAYQEFLKKHPTSEFSQQAQDMLEPLSFQNAKDEGTAMGYSAYLIRFTQGPHADDVRARLKDIRCQDPNIIKRFTSWLKKGSPSDPQRSASWFLDNTFIGIQPSNIGRGYKAAGDDPAYPLEMEWGPGQLLYFSGRGIIVGPDGTKVLVGYDCK